MNSEQGKSMDALPAEVSRQLFKAFAKLWNDGLLHGNFINTIILVVVYEDET